jgi:hypothetical protein
MYDRPPGLSAADVRGAGAADQVSLVHERRQFATHPRIPQSPYTDQKAKEIAPGIPESLPLDTNLLNAIHLRLFNTQPRPRPDRGTNPITARIPMKIIGKRPKRFFLYCML